MNVQEAKIAGLSRYVPNKPCRRGHLSWRYTASPGHCLQCIIEQNATVKVRQQHKSASTRYYAKHREKILLRNRTPEYRAKMKVHMATYVAKNPEYNSKSFLKNYTLGSNLWIRMIIQSAKKRANKWQVPFDEVALREFLSTPPTHCPIFGYEFQVGGGIKKNSPSLDRIRPHLGYVRGNLALISMKANAIKQNATADELLAVTEWVRRQCQ